MLNFKCRSLHDYELDLEQAGTEIRRNFKAWAMINGMSLTYREFIELISNSIIDGGTIAPGNHYVSRRRRKYIHGRHGTNSVGTYEWSAPNNGEHFDLFHYQYSNRRVFFENDSHVGLLIKFSILSMHYGEDKLFAIFVVYPKDIYLEALSTGRTLVSTCDDRVKLDDNVTKILYGHGKLVVLDVLSHELFYPHSPKPKAVQGTRVGWGESNISVSNGSIHDSHALGSYLGIELRNLHPSMPVTVDGIYPPNKFALQELLDTALEMEDIDLADNLEWNRHGLDELGINKNKLCGVLNGLDMPIEWYHANPVSWLKLLESFTDSFLSILDDIAPIATVVSECSTLIPVMNKLTPSSTPTDDNHEEVQFDEYFLGVSNDTLAVAVPCYLMRHDLWDKVVIPMVTDVEKIIDYYVRKIYAES